jgi:hypothetical protein
MASASLPFSSNGTKRVLWFWQANPNPFDKKEKEEWKRYSDFENEFIEEAQQRKDETVALNDYVIHFKYNVQVNKQDWNKQRPVKRELVDVGSYGREERFCLADKPVKSFTTHSSSLPPIIKKWYENNEVIADGRNYSAIAELAAAGKLGLFCLPALHSRVAV